jgi:hypothetical protein
MEPSYTEPVYQSEAPAKQGYTGKAPASSYSGKKDCTGQFCADLSVAGNKYTTKGFNLDVNSDWDWNTADGYGTGDAIDLEKLGLSTVKLAKKGIGLLENIKYPVSAQGQKKWGKYIK